MRRLPTLLLAAGLLTPLAAWPDDDVLVRIDASPGALPPAVAVHAWQQDAKGRDYAIAVATTGELAALRLPAIVLASHASPRDFVLARRRGAAWPDALPGEVVLDDGRRLLVRATREERESLAQLGFQLKPLPEQPVRAFATDLHGKQVAPAAFAAVTYDERVAEMIGQVKTTNLNALVAQWSGAAPGIAGGDFCTISTRYTSVYSPLARATTVALEHLQALGLAATQHHWSVGGYSNRNIVATLPGGALSNEIVLVTAHIDSTSPSATTRAPGADDNASGAAAVLVCADLMRRFRFDRTVRFVLFTGEEQGLYGSYRYAAACAAAGDHIAAVLNLDMIGWDATGAPELRLHTRGIANAGYTGDVAIAATFTNVVAAYGLAASLVPIITADDEAASDHSSFWDVGYPGVLAIEEDWVDFNAYYHTTNDTLARLNLPYFTAFTKAVVGTAAHLAQPAGRTPFEVIRVSHADWRTGAGLGAGVFHARHEDGATESGADAHDLAWASAPTNPYGRWLRIDSSPYGPPLATDARPVESESLIRGRLTAISTGAAPFAVTSRLHFAHLSALESNRSYRVRVALDPRYTVGSNAFLCATNLRALVAAGGFLALPTLTNLTNGAVYGTVEIGSSLQSLAPTSLAIAAVALETQLVFTAAVQPGLPVVDAIETSTNVADGAGWRDAATATSDVAVTAANFSNGWDVVTRGAAVSNAPGTAWRIRRRWIAP